MPIISTSPVLGKGSGHIGSGPFLLPEAASGAKQLQHEIDRVLPEQGEERERGQGRYRVQ